MSWVIWIWAVIAIVKIISGQNPSEVIKRRPYVPASPAPVSIAEELNCDFTGLCCWRNLDTDGYDYQIGDTDMSPFFPPELNPPTIPYLITIEQDKTATKEALFISCPVPCSKTEGELTFGLWLDNNVVVNICTGPADGNPKDYTNCQSVFENPAKVTLPASDSPFRILIATNNYISEPESIVIIKDIAYKSAGVAGCETATTTTTTTATTTTSSAAVTDPITTPPSTTPTGPTAFTSIAPDTTTTTTTTTTAVTIPETTTPEPVTVPTPSTPVVLPDTTTTASTAVITTALTRDGCPLGSAAVLQNDEPVKCTQTDECPFGNNFCFSSNCCTVFCPGNERVAKTTSGKPQTCAAPNQGQATCPDGHECLLMPNTYIALCCFNGLYVQKCEKQNEVWQDCGTNCPLSCQSPVPGACNFGCNPACSCKQGYIRNEVDGECVPDGGCPAPQPECPANEQFKECGTNCPLTCQQPDQRPCNRACNPGCFCIDGYSRNEETGQCVPTGECPAPPTTTATGPTTSPALISVRDTDSCPTGLPQPFLLGRSKSCNRGRATDCPGGGYGCVSLAGGLDGFCCQIKCPDGGTLMQQRNRPKLCSPLAPACGGGGSKKCQTFPGTTDQGVCCDS